MADLWNHEYTSGQSSSDFAFPGSSIASYFQAVGAGTVVVVCVGGAVFTKHCNGGEVIPGSYTSLTSTTCTYLVMGNGAPPPVTPVGVGAATSSVAGSSALSVAPTVATAPIAVGTNDPRVCTVEIPIVLVLADGTFAESTVWIPGVVGTITGATLSHNASVTQSNTDYLTYTLGIRDGAGGTASTVASKVTKASGASFLAFQAVSLGTITNATTAAISQVTFKSIIAGAGQAVTGPALLRITYTVP